MGLRLFADRKTPSDIHQRKSHQTPLPYLLSCLCILRKKKKISDTEFDKFKHKLRAVKWNYREFGVRTMEPRQRTICHPLYFEAEEEASLTGKKVRLKEKFIRGLIGSAPRDFAR